MDAPTTLEPKTFRLAFAGLLLGDAARLARPDDRRHRAARRSSATSAASTSSPGSSPPICSAPPSRCRCGAARATSTAASGCSSRGDRRLPGRLGAERPRRLARPADRVPRAAGPRRRRADDARDGDRRRDRLAARARPLPGLHPDGLRASRASPGRCSAACSPTTPRGAGSSTSTCRSAPPRWSSSRSRWTCPRARRRGAHRLPRRRTAGRRADLRAPVHDLGRPGVRLGLGREHRARPRRAGVARRLARPAAPRGRADPPAAAVRQPRVHDRRARAVPAPRSPSSR